MAIKSSSIYIIDIRLKNVLIKSFSNRWQYVNLFNLIFNSMMIFFINLNPFSILAFTLSAISFLILVNDSYDSYEIRISDKKYTDSLYEDIVRHDYDGEKHY
jgi:hypothetical protein